MSVKSNFYSFYSTLQDVFLDLNIPADSLTHMLASTSQFLDEVSEYVQIPTDDKVKDLVGKYIIPTCYKSVVDISVDTEDVQHEEFLAQFGSWLLGSYQRYSVLIDAYKSKEKNLLDALKTTTTSTIRSSDTPEVEGTWDGDDQLSSISSNSSETSSDPGPVISRLSEIRRGYRSLYMDWRDEFIRKFTTEVMEW